jgi:lipoprotein-anchoring transpeptidase ErfK/SrfK
LICGGVSEDDMRLLTTLVLGVAFLCSTAAQAEILVRVDKAAQRMQVFVDGEPRYNFVVSTGLAGGPPNGTFRPQRLERVWHSRLYNMAPMPYSIFFHGNFAIHGTDQVRRLGRPASKGCVRLHPDNAAILFNLVRKYGMAKTRIVIAPGRRPVGLLHSGPGRTGG